MSVPTVLYVSTYRHPFQDPWSPISVSRHPSQYPWPLMSVPMATRASTHCHPFSTHGHPRQHQWSSMSVPTVTHVSIHSCQCQHKWSLMSVLMITNVSTQGHDQILPSSARTPVRTKWQSELWITVITPSHVQQVKLWNTWVNENSTQHKITVYVVNHCKYPQSCSTGQNWLTFTHFKPCFQDKANKQAQGGIFLVVCFVRLFFGAFFFFFLTQGPIIWHKLLCTRHASFCINSFRSSLNTKLPQKVTDRIMSNQAVYGELYTNCSHWVNGQLSLAP